MKGEILVREETYGLLYRGEIKLGARNFYWHFAFKKHLEEIKKIGRRCEEDEIGSLVVCEGEVELDISSCHRPLFFGILLGIAELDRNEAICLLRHGQNSHQATISWLFTVKDQSIIEFVNKK